MSDSATIIVVSGPDRGKMFQVTADQISIGLGADNDVALSDQSLEGHQASIVLRNGRYAIYSPIDETIEVDGKVIPAERWVWLPDTARLRVSSRTILQFNMNSHVPSKNSKKIRSKSKKSGKPAPSKKRKRRRNTAQFITDQVGESLVQLGDDGTLPDLHLEEPQVRSPRDRQQQKQNPFLLYIVCGVSLLMSIGMLFMEFELPKSRSVAEIQRARIGIRAFYGNPADELEPYQLHLREAQRAHSSNDWRTEREEYRRVLDLLNSEDRERGRNSTLTGNANRDTELREFIGTLLSQ